MSTESKVAPGGCSRCNEYECICGDPAFEAWVEEELAAQRADDEQREANHAS